MAINEEFEQLLLEGTELLERGQIDQSMSKAMEALTLRPGNPMAENLLGLVLFSRRRFREARDIFEGLARRHPDVASLRINAGLTALRTDGTNRAKAHFDRVLQLEPDHRRALAYLALLSFKAGDRGKTRSLLQKADLDRLADRMNQHMDDEATLWLALDIESRADQLAPGRGSGPLPPRAFEGFAEVMPLVPEDSWDKRSSQERQELRMTTRVPPADLNRVNISQARQHTVPLHTMLDVGPRPLLDTAPIQRRETGPQGVTRETGPLPHRARRQTGPPRRRMETGPPESLLPESRLRTRRETRRQTSPLWPLTARTELAESAHPLTPSGSIPLGPHWLEHYLVDDSDAGLPAELRGGLLTLRMGKMANVEDADAVYLRQDQLILEQGELDWKEVQRRRMGQDQGDFELAEGVPLLQASGDGRILMLSEPSLHFELLQLKENTLFIREDSLSAFSADLFWENGNIPGLSAKGPPMVLFRGNGFVALSLPGTVQAMQVHSTNPTTIRLEHLLGWTAEVVPQIESRHPGMPGDTLIRCTGPGMALLDYRRSPPGP